MDSPSSTMRGPLPDELHSIIREKNVSKQFSRNVPVIYGGTFMFNSQGTLPLQALGLGVEENATTVEDNAPVLKMGVGSHTTIAIADVTFEGMAMTTPSTLGQARP